MDDACAYSDLEGSPESIRRPAAENFHSNRKPAWVVFALASSEGAYVKEDTWSLRLRILKEMEESVITATIAAGPALTCISSKIAVPAVHGECAVPAAFKRSGAAQVRQEVPPILCLS